MGRLNDGPGSASGDLAPGETREIHVRDKSGNITKTITVYRTDREYVHDLCDAYNAARSAAALRQGIEWFVTPAGELRIGHSFDSMLDNAKRIDRRNETERARFTRHQLEHCP